MQKAFECWKIFRDRLSCIYLMALHCTSWFRKSFLFLHKSCCQIDSPALPNAIQIKDILDLCGAPSAHPVDIGTGQEQRPGQLDTLDDEVWRCFPFHPAQSELAFAAWPLLTSLRAPGWQLAPTDGIIVPRTFLS